MTSNLLGQSKTFDAIDALRSYAGSDPYILWLKTQVIDKKDLKQLNKLTIDYIVKNKTTKDIVLNKGVVFEQWFAQKKQEQWNCEFLPNRFFISRIIGESDNAFGVYGKYRGSLPNDIFCLIPKNALLTNIDLDRGQNLNIDFDKYDAISSKKGISLMPHQKEAIRFLVKKRKAILADGCGLGKTLTTIVSSLEGGYKRILIICPASIKSTWKRELLTYVDESEISIVNGRNWNEAKFTIINYDILKNFYEIAEEPSFKKIKDPMPDGTIIEKKIQEWKVKPVYDEHGMIVTEGIPKMKQSKNKELIRQALENSQLYQSNFDLVIIDECHRLSNNTSGIFKITSDLLKHLKPEGIFAITGTPMTNRPMNLYNILRLINHPIADNWENYVKRYCEGTKFPLKGEWQKFLTPYLYRHHKSAYNELSFEEKADFKAYFEKNGRFIWKTSGASNLDELSEKIKSCYIRRINTEIAGMVKKEIIVKSYDLSAKQELDYNKVWDQYEKQCKEKGFNANEEYRMLTEGVMLRMYLSKEMIQHTIDLAEEHIENGSKVLLLCNYNDELYELQKHFGKMAVIYNGSMNAKDKDKSEYEFMHNDNIKVFVGNIEACGVGLTLTAGNIAIFNSFSWVPADNNQAMDRVFRITQKEDVKIYFQIYNNTASSDMWDKINDKTKVIDNVVVRS